MIHHLQNIRRKEEGLTLIELTVVTAILGVLAAITVITMTGVILGSKASAKAADEANITQAAEEFAAHDNAGEYPVLRDSDDDSIMTYNIDDTLDIDEDEDTDTVDVFFLDWDAADPDGDKFYPDYIKNVSHRTKTDCDPTVNTGDETELDDNPDCWVWVKSIGEAKVLLEDSDY